MVTKWQTLFLLVMTLPIMGHVVILPIMLDVAGRDILLSIVISLPTAVLLTYTIFRIRLNHPTLTAPEMLFHLLGKGIGRIVILLFVLYFLFLTILSFASLIDFVYIGFLPDTPIIVLVIWFFIFFLYAAAKGFKQIALTAGLLAIIGVVTGHAITIMDSKFKDWSELLPFLEFGWGPPLWGSLILTSIWMELLMLLFIPIKNIREKCFFLIWLIGISIVALTMFSTANGAITIFGLSQAENFNYPAQEIVRLISLSFLDRFDIYGMILMSFGVYIRCSLFFRITYELLLPKVVSTWTKRIIFILLSIITFFGAFYLAQEHFRIEKAINFYAYMIVLFPIPFILLFISWVKKAK